MKAEDALRRLEEILDDLARLEVSSTTGLSQLNDDLNQAEMAIQGY